MIRDIPLEDITLDDRTMVRERVDDETANHYAERLEAGDVFPPIKCRAIGGNLIVLGAGRHRYKAHQIAKRETISAIVEPGTITDALLDAIDENRRNARQMSEGDRKAEVRRALLDEGIGKWPQDKIAERCGVSQQFVSKVKGKMEEAGELQPVVIQGEDGKPKAKKGRPKGSGKAKPEGEKPPTAPKAPTVRVVRDRDADTGEESQDVPGDDLPVTKIETPTVEPDAYLAGIMARIAEKPKEELPPKPFVPALFAGEQDDGLPEFNVPVERDRALALFRGLFIEWPKKHHPILCEAFDDAQTESAS